MVHRSGWVVLLVSWLASSAYVMARLPRLPVMTGDSGSYIEQAANRPPAYGWLLQAFHAASGSPDFAWLPQLQTALIALALLGFTWQMARLLRAPLAMALLPPLVWTHTGVYEATRFLMSEGLFLAAMLAGLACCIAQVRRGGLQLLAAACLCFAVATLARSAGAALMLLPPLLVLLRRPLRPAAVLVVLLASMAPVLLGMASHRARHGEFALGSYAGVSLLGKALLLLQPAQADAPVLQAMLPLAEQARSAVATAPDAAAGLRAQAQAYEELRWRAFFPLAETLLPGWQPQDLGQQNRLASGIARRIVASAPGGYLQLVLRDWAGLQLYPHFWPFGTAAPATLPTIFAPCGDAPDRCWALFPLQVPRLYGTVMLSASLVGLAATLVLLLRHGLAAIRRRLPPAPRLLLAMALVAQASLAVTALFEAGLWRYTIAAHAINAALAIWLGTTLLRALRRRAWGG